MHPPVPITLRSLLRPLYEFVFTPSCLSCGRPLVNSPSKVCASCWSAIRTVDPADTLYLETVQKLRSSGHISDLVSAFYFDKDGPLQDLLHLLKYNGMTDLGLQLGDRVGELLYPLVAGTAPAGIVPVPLHRSKQRERGYNQSEFICRGVSASTRLPILPVLLRRTRHTVSQTQLHIDDRKKNVEGAFAVHPSFAAGISKRTVVLVDDVVTTGATLDACAAVLCRFGADRVIACTVAIAA